MADWAFLFFEVVNCEWFSCLIFTQWRIVIMIHTATSDGTIRALNVYLNAILRFSQIIEVEISSIHLILIQIMPSIF